MVSLDNGPADSSGACPADVELCAYADGSLDAVARARIEGHAVDCEACAAQVASLMTLADTPPAPVPEEWLRRVRRIGTPAGQRAGLWRRAVPLAAAASLLLVATLGIQLSRHETRAPAVRGTGRVAPGVAIQTPADEEWLGPARPVTWTSHDEAYAYVLTVKRENGDPVWTDQTQQPSSVVPSSIDLAPGERAFLSVSARLADGRTVASRAVAFRWAPR